MFNAHDSANGSPNKEIKEGISIVTISNNKGQMVQKGRRIGVRNGEEHGQPFADILVVC